MKVTMNRTGWVGRILRLLLGIFFITEVYPVYRDVTLEGSLIRLGWTLALIIFYVLVHIYVTKYLPNINKITGAILAIGPFLAVFFIGYGGPPATGALTFIALSLIIAAIRADSGCEVMSIPTLILGKHTHLCCIIFSPIDSIEKGIK